MAKSSLIKGCVVEIVEEPIGGEEPRCVARAVIEMHDGDVLSYVFEASRWDIPQDYKCALRQIAYLNAKIGVLEKTLELTDEKLREE